MKCTSYYTQVRPSVKPRLKEYFFLYKKSAERTRVLSAAQAVEKVPSLVDFFHSLVSRCFSAPPGRKSPRFARRLPCCAREAGDMISLEAGFRPLELPRLILNHPSLKKRDPQAGRRRGPVSSPPQFTCFQYFLPQLRTFWPNGRCPIKRLRPFHPAQRVSSPRDWIRRLRREMALCRFITMEAT